MKVNLITNYQQQKFNSKRGTITNNANLKFNPAFGFKFSGDVISSPVESFFMKLLPDNGDGGTLLEKMFKKFASISALKDSKDIYLDEVVSNGKGGHSLLAHGCIDGNYAFKVPVMEFENTNNPLKLLDELVLSEENIVEKVKQASIEARNKHLVIQEELHNAFADLNRNRNNPFYVPNQEGRLETDNLGNIMMD